MSVNLSVILTDDEVCLRTEAGCEIYSLQRVDTDEKRTSAEEQKIMSLFPRKYKSRLVGCSNLETTEGFLTDPPAGDVQYRLELVRTSSCLYSFVRFHERILLRTGK